MAVRFFERIAKTYRRERWGTLLRPLLATWYKCAQQLGDVELSIRILVEMLAHGTPFPFCWILVAEDREVQVLMTTKTKQLCRRTFLPCLR